MLQNLPLYGSPIQNTSSYYDPLFGTSGDFFLIFAFSVGISAALFFLLLFILGAEIFWHRRDKKLTCSMAALAKRFLLYWFLLSLISSVGFLILFG